MSPATQTLHALLTDLERLIERCPSLGLDLGWTLRNAPNVSPHRELHEYSEALRDAAAELEVALARARWLASVTGSSAEGSQR